MSEQTTIPPPPPKFDISAKDLEQNAKDLIDYIQQATARLINSCTDNTTADFETIILPLAGIDNKVKSRIQYIALFQAISPCVDIRKASSAAINLVDKAYLSIFQNDDIFRLVNRVREHASAHLMDEEDTRLLNKFHWMFVENGMYLTGKSRERFTWISRRLIELRVKFMETLGTDPGCLWKSKEQLVGVPLDRLSTGADEDGREDLYRVPLTKPITNLILSECRVSETRKDVFLHSSTRYKDNVEIFREIIVLRDESSRLLGFPSFAARKLSQQMLASPARVDGFLQHLHDALKPLADDEMLELQELAKTRDPIQLWDFDFYHTRMLQEQNHVDHEYISQWFPAKVTIQRMLGIYGNLFGLQFEKVEALESFHTWHPDVDLFSVWEENKSSFIGYLYIDIFPRDELFKHRRKTDSSGNGSGV